MSNMIDGADSFQQSFAPTTHIKKRVVDAICDVRPRGQRVGLLPDMVSFEDGDMDQLPLSTLFLAACMNGC